MYAIRSYYADGRDRMRSARNARRTLLACTVLLGALALHAGPGEAKGKATYAKA